MIDLGEGAIYGALIRLDLWLQALALKEDTGSWPVSGESIEPEPLGSAIRTGADGEERWYLRVEATIRRADGSAEEITGWMPMGFSVDRTDVLDPVIRPEIGDGFEVERGAAERAETMQQWLRRRYGTWLIQTAALDQRPLAPVRALLASILGESNMPVLAVASASGTRLLRAEGTTTADALGVFVAIPVLSAEDVASLMDDDDSTGPTNVTFVSRLPADLQPDRISFVPPNVDFGMVYSRALLDMLMAAVAISLVGTKVGVAEIRSLSVFMGLRTFQVRGMAHVEVTVDMGAFDSDEETDVTIGGGFSVNLVRGDRHIQVDTDGISLKDDLDFCKRWIAGDEIDDAKDDARRTIATIISQKLDPLAETLVVPTRWGFHGTPSVTVESTPDHMQVTRGHIALWAQAFVQPITRELTFAWYHWKLRRFYAFDIAGERRFATGELARLIDTEKITVPGLQSVGGEYLRTTPDGDPDNNLLALFAPRHA